MTLQHLSKLQINGLGCWHLNWSHYEESGHEVSRAFLALLREAFHLRRALASSAEAEAEAEAALGE